MCLGLGLGCCLGIIEILPYVFLVSVPLLGSFYGIETIFRFSILLIIHGVIIECIPKVLFRIVPLLNLLSFLLLMYLPTISLTPWPVVWLYEKVIWLSNPFLMITEVVLLQNFVMRQSQNAADEIEKDESSTLNKGAILVVSAFCYAVTASLVYDIYTNGAPSQVLCLFVVLLMLIAIHNMMLMAHEGIISDCAFCSCLSIFLLYIMIVETQQISEPLLEPNQWKTGYTSGFSVFDIMYSVLNTSSANAQRSIAFLKRFFSPMFLGLLAVRLYSILFVANKITKNFFIDWDKDDDDKYIIDLDQLEDELEQLSPFRSPLVMRASIIFMLTQFTAHFLEEWSGQTSSLAFLTTLTAGAWPSQILFSRLMQILSVNVFYMWRLYRADNWTWNPWLTPS